jgi:hypothetical protein
MVGDNAARLLPAMLERMKAEGDEVGRICQTYYPENAALFVQSVVVKWIDRKCGRADRNLM